VKSLSKGLKGSRIGGVEDLLNRTAEYRTRPPARRAYASERIMNIEGEKITS
jgi:hypothetical protein